MQVFWGLVLVLVIIHLRLTQVLVELSDVHFAPDCSSLFDALGPAASLLLVVQSASSLLITCMCDPRTTLSPAAVYPPVNRGVLAVPSAVFGFRSPASCGSWGCVQLPQQHVSTY